MVYTSWSQLLSGLLVILNALLPRQAWVCATTEPGGCDLSDPVFRGFLERTRAYYTNGSFSLEDALRVSNLVSLPRALLSVCPVAVLQAILLKLEENLVYEPRAYQDLMAEYALYMQAALIAQSLTKTDLETWPLADGIHRVRAVSKALERGVGRNLSSAMVMNFCQPEDRFGTVHALAWLLEPPFGEQSVLLQDTDLYIYLVDAPWCKDLDRELVRQLGRVFHQVHLVKYTGGPGREEQTAYFKFIVDHYDELPDFTIFVHPDAPEHQGVTFPALTRALQVIRTHSEFAEAALGYYPLAWQMVVDPRRTWKANYAEPWQSFWHRLYGQPWSRLGHHPPRCRWDVTNGKFLAGIAPGTSDQGMSLHAAKAACYNVGEACAGVTCGYPEENHTAQEEDGEAKALPPWHEQWWGIGQDSCTARQGLPVGLFDSVFNEVSFTKVCAAEPGGSAHEDAVPLPKEGDSMGRHAGTYTQHRGMYLPDYAVGDSEERPAKAARKRCDDLGRACGGYTCTASGTGLGDCTVRAGTELLASPIGEVSFKRRDRYRLPELPSTPGASEVFQFYTGSQSIVRKDRLLAWAREDLAIFMEDGQFCTDHSGLFEAVWHVMFGEPLSQWTREEDPSLPLHLKWMIPTKLSYGDMGVV